MNYLKRFTVSLIIILNFLTIIGFKNAQIYPEKIAWNTHFKGKFDSFSPYLALTATIWQYSYKATVEGNTLNIDFNFIGGVNPEKSWVKLHKIINKETSKQLLNHEQGHVYINYLLLKNGEFAIRNQVYTIKNYKNLIKQTADKTSKYYSEMQKKYDVQTDHGADLIAQKRWDIFIKNEMSKTK